LRIAIRIMRIDPTAALRCWSIDVDIAGGTYTIPPLPAADWISAVQDGWLAIVPGLLQDADHLDDLIADGQLSYDDCRRAAQDALAAAAGTKWWTATRLVGWVLHERIAGRLALKGVDPSQVSLAGLFLAAYETVASSVEKAK